MADSKLTRIDIEGYRSIKQCSVTLDDINILIGANGAGKSNFISAFSLIQKVISKELQAAASKCGIQNLFFNGPKITKSISIVTYFGSNSYGFTLEPTDDQRLMFTDEDFGWQPVNYHGGFGKGYFESKWEEGIGNRIDKYIQPVLAAKAWRVYHFQDTTRNSAMKTPCNIHDNVFLQQDAGNIAAFLLRLREEYPESYSRITSVVKRVNPYFNDFVLVPNESSGDVLLRWSKTGTDMTMGPHQLSDGTIRFICLATLLLQPYNLMPTTIVLDEPELGLFPQAMIFLAEMIRSAATRRQIIISTQSVDLVDEFGPENIIIVEDSDEGSRFRRPDPKTLEVWLNDDYTLGTLWKKNLLQGE